MSRKGDNAWRVSRAVLGPRGSQPKFLYFFYVHPYKIKPYFLFLCVDLSLGRCSFFSPLPIRSIRNPCAIWGLVKCYDSNRGAWSSALSLEWKQCDMVCGGVGAGWKCRCVVANSVPTLWHEAEEYRDRWANITLHSQLNFVNSVFTQIVTCKNFKTADAQLARLWDQTNEGDSWWHLLNVYPVWHFPC